MADYRNKKQDDRMSKFPKIFMTFSEKVERLGEEVLTETKQSLKAINLTLQDIVKNQKEQSAEQNAKFSNNKRSAEDYLDLVVKGITDIVSFLYKRPFKDEQLGTLSRIALQPFINAAKPGAKKEASGSSSDMSGDIGVNTVQRLIRLLEEVKPDGYEDQTDAVVDALTDWQKVMRLIEKNSVKTDQIKNFTKVSKDVIYLFNLLTKESPNRIIRARIGRMAVSSMHSYFSYFAEKFGSDKELQKAGVQIGLLNRGLMINMRDFWSNFDEQVQIAGNPIYPVRIALVLLSAKSAGKYFSYLANSLVPELNDLAKHSETLQKGADAMAPIERILGLVGNLSVHSVRIVLFGKLIKKATDIAKTTIGGVREIGMLANQKRFEKTANSLKPVTVIFKSLAGISSSAVFIVVSGPLVSKAVIVAKKMIKDISSIADTANANRKRLEGGLAVLGSIRNMLIVAAGVVVVAALIGSMKGIVKSTMKGLGMILMTMAAVSLITYAVSALGKSQARAGGKNGILTPFTLVKDMLKAALLTMAAAVGVSLLMPVIGPMIFKGLLAITGVLLAVVAVSVVIKAGINAFGGQFAIRRPFKIVRDMIICAAATIVIAWMTGLLVEAQFPQLLKGMGVVLLAYAVIIGSFRLVTMGARGLSGRHSAKHAIHMLGGLVLFSFVTIIGMIMVGKLLKPGEILMAMAVPLTLLLIGYTFKLISPMIRMTKREQKSIRELMIFSIASAALIIIVGKMVTPESLIGVAIFLGCLIGMAYAIKFVTKITSKLFNTKKKIEGFAVFLGSVLASAAVMALVSVLGNTIDIVSVGVVMICMVGLAFVMKLLDKVGTKKIERGAKNLLIMCGAVIAASVGLYVLAAASERFNDRTWEAFGMLALCVGGFAAMAVLLSKQEKNVLKGVLVLAAVGVSIGINSAALLLLAEVSERFNENTWKAFGLLAATVGAFGAMAVGLGFIAGPAALGCLVLAGIGGAVAANAAALLLLADVSERFNENTWKAFGLLSATVGAFGAMAALLGAMAGPIALGVIALTALSGAVALATTVIGGIIKAANNVQENTLSKTRQFGPILLEFIKAFTNIPTKLLAELALKGPFIMASILPLSVTIGTLAKAIEEYANLKVAIYEGKEIVGYRQLSQEDFQSAADNVAKIISTVGGAILSLYYGNSYMSPELAYQMFHINLRGHSPFMDVVTSCSKMGGMIAKIAQGVASYAKLKIPVYKGTEISEYRQLGDDDFKNAAKNISKIVITIGTALMAMYYAYPKFFKEGWIRKSPFNVMLDSCTKMGDMLGKIADGIQKMASGTYEKYEGNQKKTVNLGPEDFKAAAKNVSDVVTIIGTTLMVLYGRYPKFFKDGWIKDAPFSKMLDACLKMGKLISSFADPVSKIAKATFDKYSESGEKIGTYNLTKKEFEGAAANVGSLIGTLASSLTRAYRTHKGFFENKDKIQDKIKSGTDNLVKVLSSTSNAVFNMAKLRIPVYDEATGKAKGYRSLNTADFMAAGVNTGVILTALLAAVEKVYNDSQTGGLFKNVIGPDGKPTKESTLNRIMTAISPVGKFLSDLACGVSAFAKAMVPVYGDNGKIVKYVSLTPSDYNQMGKNVGLLLSSLITSLKNAYENNKPMFEEDTVKKISEGMKPAMELMSSVSKAVVGMAAGTYEVYDENGKARKVNLTPFHYMMAGINIHMLITTIFDALIKVSKHELVKDLSPDQAFGPNSKLGLLVEMTKKITDVVGGFGDMIGRIAVGEYSVKNADGSDKKVTLNWEDLLKVGPNLSLLYTTVLGSLNDIVSSEAYKTFIENKVAEEIEKSTTLMKTQLQGIIEISDFLEKNKDKRFNPASVHAYNEFIKGFKIETVQADSTQKINAAAGLVKSVNTLDISKANTMIRLLEELNMLSIRLGGLDRFTQVLSDTLAVQLDKLTRELIAAATVIDKSDKMQKAREDSIKRIVTEINQMLQQPISVTPVMQQMDENGNPIPTAGANYDPNMQTNTQLSAGPVDTGADPSKKQNDGTSGKTSNNTGSNNGKDSNKQQNQPASLQSVIDETQQIYKDSGRFFKGTGKGESSSRNVDNTNRTLKGKDDKGKRSQGVTQKK